MLFGFIFYLAAVHLKDARLRRVCRPCLWIILVTGAQRVYGDHWPSDVLAATAWGLRWRADRPAPACQARTGGLS
jgi:hypothetical protein